MVAPGRRPAAVRPATEAYAEFVSKVSFLLRPRWLVSHVFVAVLVVTMISLGFWQLDRLDQRRERNDLISDRREEPAVAVDTLLSSGDDAAAVEDLRYRVVEATGTYDDDASFEVRNRTLDGTAGVWAVTPLQFEGGERVGVVRGFVAFGQDDEPDIPPAPGGEVTVTGVLGSPDGFDGTAPQDLEPFVEADDSLPGLVMAESSEPPEEGWGTVMHAVPPPDLEEGPHMAYAAQWFIFATIAALGYPLVLYRIVQRRQRDAALAREANARSNGERKDLDRELDDILGSGSSHG